MALEKDELLSPDMEKARNNILIQYAELSFAHALDEVKSSLETETDSANRLVLLAAKSWIIRNKIHVLMNEPFTYSLNELEGTNIFSDNEDESSSSDIDGLFDDDDDDDDENDQVGVTLIKTTTLKGVKLLKDTVAEVSKDDAKKLVSEKKAKYLD
ncbi:MAG: hypothetical protein RMX26_01965 [Planktomarina sp.]|nr:hypothetical protein [Planktomarina sp.]